MRVVTLEVDMANGTGGMLPGGISAVGQQSAAVQALFSQAIRPVRRKTTRKKATTKKRRKTAVRKSPAKRAAKRGGRLKKGSPAAKRRMAQLRRMQKRR